jgi:hypothetical protein
MDGRAELLRRFLKAAAACQASTLKLDRFAAHTARLLRAS